MSFTPVAFTLVEHSLLSMLDLFLVALDGARRSRILIILVGPCRSLIGPLVDPLFILDRPSCWPSCRSSLQCWMGRLVDPLFIGLS